MSDWRDCLRPLPVLRFAVLVMLLGYAFAIGFLIGRVTS